mgnify:CR=1 FL=1
MRNTKTMVLSICTFILTVILINTLTWYLEDTWTFKESFAHGATIGLSLIFGWIPAAVIARDFYHRI